MRFPQNLASPFFCFFTMAGIFVLSSVFSAPAFAYDEDTHFVVTYVICRSVGFNRADALLVAAVDQGMDDSSDTISNGGPFGAIPYVEKEWRWHALDLKGKMRAAGIIARRDALYQEALREPLRRGKLIRLGVFFHYQQDSWAHRHHGRANHLSRDNYTPFTTPLGHGLSGHVPDGPPADPVAALMNLEDGIVFARRFLKEGLGEEPSSFLADYVPQGGSVYTNWPDKRKGKYFNQIDREVAAEGSPRRYLLDIIYEQIEAYEKCVNFFPHYFLRRTAVIPEPDCVRKALEKVGEKYRLYPDTGIPSGSDKAQQGFCRLTTAELLMSPLPENVPANKEPCKAKDKACKKN